MSETGNSATLQLLGLGNRVARWIGESVTALADDLAGSAPTAAQCKTMVMITNGGTEIHQRNKSGKWELVSRLTGDAGAGASSLGSVVKGLTHRDTLLRIDTNRAVVQHLTLPAGTLEVLPAVIRNKVESLAPWPLHEAMWGHVITSPPQAGQIGVDVGIISRKAVNGLLSTLGQASAKVVCLDIGRAADDGEAITVDFQEVDRTRTTRRILAAIISVAGVIALGATLYGSFLAYTAHAERASIEGRIDELTQSLRGTGASAGASAKLAEANTLYVRKLETLPSVIILNALTRLIPDGTWLTDLDYDGKQVTVTGRGLEVPRIIESLESSEEFSSVNFASATQRDPDIDADSFSISATVEKKALTQ